MVGQTLSWQKIIKAEAFIVSRPYTETATGPSGPGPLLKPVGYAYSATVFDFDDDGNSDVAICESSAVAIYFNNGDGTFTRSSALRTSAVYAALGDVNQDGKVDLVLDGNDGVLKLCLGKGDGTFQAPQTIASGTFGPIKVTDIDRDGSPDIAVAQHAGGGLVILRGLGDGTFEPGLEFLTGHSFNDFFVLNDLNGDGKVDAIVNAGPGKLTVLLNTSP